MDRHTPTRQPRPEEDVFNHFSLLRVIWLIDWFVLLVSCVNWSDFFPFAVECVYLRIFCYIVSSNVGKQIWLNRAVIFSQIRLIIKLTFFVFSTNVFFSRSKLTLHVNEHCRCQARLAVVLWTGFQCTADRWFFFLLFFFFSFAFLRTFSRPH